MYNINYVNSSVVNVLGACNFFSEYFFVVVCFSYKGKLIIVLFYMFRLFRA